MKIITASGNWDIENLYNMLQDKLDPLFKKTRQMDTHVAVSKLDNTIEVSIPDLYSECLFRLTAHGRELHVAKSEHYVDDVNQLTLQAFIETLEMEYRDGAYIVKISGE